MFALFFSHRILARGLPKYSTDFLHQTDKAANKFLFIFTKSLDTRPNYML
jgi:hypothetical protein